MIVTHPGDDDLARYGLGELPDAEAESVAVHLSACPACQRRVAALSADSFVARPAAAPALTGGYTGVSLAVRAIPDDAAPPPPELLLLTQYSGLRELGRGGMGVVYLARHVPMDRLEVLKVVQRSSLEKVGGGAVERFLREIRAAARLQHPNVVTAYTVHTPGDLLVFAMEYAPGHDLARVVQNKGPLPVPVGCSYVVAAANGLQHAHEAGMVHRDIKPSNLILTKVNGKPTVKVLDFGLAKVTTGDPGGGDLTGDGRMMGTPDYMAPEQALDAARADTRADVYALGCTLYFLLTGRAPFAGGTLMQVIDRHRFGTAKPLDEVQPAVPKELAAVVAKMLAKDPADRFPTPGEVAKALRPFVSQPATRPQPSAAPKSAVETSRPSQTLPRSPTARPAPARAPRRRSGALAGAVALALVALALGGAHLAGVFKVKTPNGTVVVSGVPADAVVTIDGQTASVTRAGETVTVAEVTKGVEHQLRVTKGGAELFAESVTVKLGEAEVKLQFVPEPDAVPPLAVVPAEPPPLAVPPGEAAADLLPAGSFWRGERSYTAGRFKGKTLPYFLKVETRAGKRFAGTTYHDGPRSNPSQVRGTLDGTTISYRQVGGPGGKNYAVTGELDGDTIRYKLAGDVWGDARGKLTRAVR